MAKVGVKRAAELTGKSKSTIQRSMNNGKLSFELDANGHRIIDLSELNRVFGLSQTENSAPSQSAFVQVELEKASQLIEMERMKMRIKMLEEKLEMTESILDDLREQRNQWQKQAAQTLVTSQYSQQQAAEMREEIKERERKARARRQRILEKTQSKQGLTLKMQEIHAENQNELSGKFSVQGLWKKIKSSD